MTRNPNAVADGIASCEAGMDSGRSADLLAPNQHSFLVNCTVRGGWPYPRPGYRKIDIDWNGDEEVESAFKESLFQGGWGFTYDAGEGALISMQGGRQFRVSVGNFEGSEISTPGYQNNPTIPIAYGEQSENFFIIQDGQSKPFIWNGASSFRAGPRQVPVGKQMAYYFGRLWVAQGTQYVAGDIVFGPPTYNRATILNFTENDYLNEGGAFGVPAQFGEITALKPIASINTVLGQGELIVGTRRGMFATQVPFDRTQWKNLTQPAQRVIQLTYGPMSQQSVVAVNEDLFFRSRMGQNSLAYSVRNAGQWGNRSVSNEMVRTLNDDSESFLDASSAVSFDNRLLQTASTGFKQGRGTYFRCLTVLNFDLITSMRETLQPAWEGIWTGLKILRIVTVEHMGIIRCFMYVLNDDDEIELWEMTKDDLFDWNGEERVRIEWSLESRAFNFRDRGSTKKLLAEHLWYDRLNETVDFTMEYKPDFYPCWIPWETWSDCAATMQCPTDECNQLKNLQEQYRPKRTLNQPSSGVSPNIQIPYRTATQFQTRLTVKGFCRLRQQQIVAQIVQENPFPNQV